MMETRPDGMYAYIAPYLKQAKQIAWRKLKRMVTKIYGKNWKTSKVEKNEAELWVQFPNGARIQLFGADNADAIRGIYIDGGVMDEIADMRSDVYNGVIRPALADREGWLLFIGTPKGMNELYKFYQRGLGKHPLWKSLMFSVTETKLPWLPASEIKALEEDMTEAMFRQEMLCDFQASSDDVLFKLDMLHKSANLQLRLSDLEGSAKVMGVDVAGPGKDKTVVTKKHGLMVFPQQSYKLKTSPEITQMIASEIIQWQPDAVIIDNGRGFAVVEQLQRMGYDMVYGVDFGGTPNAPHYLNKRAEMVYRTLKALQSGMKIPNDPRLFAQLSAHKADLGERGKIKIIEKKKITELLRMSPDEADSLFLTNAFDVMPRIVHPLQNPKQSGTVGYGGGVLYNNMQQDYDPYASERE